MITFILIRLPLFTFHFHFMRKLLLINNNITVGQKLGYKTSNGTTVSLPNMKYAGETPDVQ